MHTPAPWEWIESPEYGYSALVGPNNAEVLVPGGINDGDTPITWMGEELSDEDRSLIEAAPDLLEACEMAVRELCAMQIKIDDAQGLEAHANGVAILIAHAIAKATPGAHPGGALGGAAQNGPDSPG